MKISKFSMGALAPALLLGLSLAAQGQITGFGGSGAGWTLNGAPGISNNVLTIVNGFNNANSAFYNARQNISNGFTVSFVWQNTIPFDYNGNNANPADGMVFTLQTQGSNAVGGVGGSLGYDGISPNTGVAFDLYPGHTVGLGYAPNSTGNNSFVYQATGPVNFDSTDPIAVNIIYNNNTTALSVSVTDTTTLAFYSTAFTVDLVADAGGSTAFVGFTGASASGESIQTISNFTFAPLAAPSAGSVITNNLPANVAIINISCTQYGAVLANASLWDSPFATGGATNLLEYTVQPGTYNFRIVDPADAAQIFPGLTPAQTSGIFTALSYVSPWQDSYLVFPASAATNSSIYQLFDGVPISSSFSDGSAVHNANEAYNNAIVTGAYNLIRTGPLGLDSTIITNSYTFTNAQTLIFTVRDAFLSDNAGGVSVAILPVSDLPAIIPLGSQTTYTDAIHLVNDSGQDVVSVLNASSPFVTDFKGESDVTITKLSGTVQPDQLDTFGGNYAANNPYYVTNFIGASSSATGDATPGDLKDIDITNGVSLQFDFGSQFSPNDRLLMIDVDTVEQYQIQAFVKTGFAYAQVPLTGWIVSNYAGSTLQTPAAANWPAWNPNTGILASPAGESLNEDLVVLVPNQAVDRVIITQIAGNGAEGANIQFIGNVGPLDAPLNQNVLLNGDFSGVNTGFSSALPFVATNTAYGQYGVTTNAQSFNSTFASFRDHTTGTGMMMVVNASTTLNLAVWSETVRVEPFTQYLFSYWAASAETNYNAVLQPTVNGNPAGPTNVLPVAAGQWQQFQFTWNSGTNTSAALAIIDNNEPNFALDDLSFVPVTGGVPLASQTVPCGSSASFTIQATGPSLTYQWWENDGSGFYVLSGATNASLVLPYVGASYSGSQFYVVASSGFGLVTSPAATLTVTDTSPPIFELTPNQVNPQGALTEGTNGNFYGTTSGGGSNNFGTVFEISPAGVLTPLYFFTGGSNGNNPVGALVLGTNGNFYGVTQNGGTNSNGTIFEITHSGVLTTLTGNFGDGGNPAAGLTLGRDGNFYGTTEFGGANGYGTVFKATPAGTATTLHDLSAAEGGYPQGGLLLGRDGNFYGTANSSGQGYGSVFKITPAGVFTSLYYFSGGDDGGSPQGSLAQGLNGDIYGATFNGGTNGAGAIFQITPSGTFTSIHSFDNANDGADPAGGLTLGFDGNLYGTTEYGSLGGGSIFLITPSGAFTTLYQFSGSENGDGPTVTVVQGSDGNFYGATAYSGLYGNGTVFRVTPAGILNTLAAFQPSTITVECHTPFALPTANDACAGAVPVFLVSGSVNTNVPGAYTVSYGATGSSGISITNTFVVKVVDTTAPTILPVGGNGFNPNSGLIAGPNGNFYGTTQTGGTYNQGTVFAVSPLGLVTNIYSFTGTNDGGNPAGILLLGGDGNFYGSATTGGTAGFGEIFKLSPAGVLTVLHECTGGVDGGGLSSLVVGSGGAPPGLVLYGTTQYGGTNGDGSVFSLTGAGNFTTLYSFANGNDGEAPVGLTLGSNADFYGTTQNGGAGGHGTVFQITPSGLLTTLYAFTNGADGGTPASGVFQGTNGNFYGATHSGGAAGNGVIFEVSPSGLFRPLYSFTGNISSTSLQAILGNDGNFYGVGPNGGANQAGAVFQLTESGQFTVLASFNYSDGSTPMGTLAIGPGGNFFGSAYYGGYSGNGTVFQMTPSGALSDLASFGGGITLTCGSSFADPGITVNDSCAGTNLPFTVNGAVNSSKPGVYVLQYFATDPATNIGYYYRPVTVLDASAPTLVLNGGSVLNVVLGTSFADPGATALGACGNTNTVLVSGAVNVNVPGNYLVTYVGTTANGLSVTNFRTVVVSTNGQSTSCLPPPSGLAAWWPADKNTLDIIGGDDGVLNGSASYGQGIVGSAFDFGSSNQAVLIPYSAAIDLTILPAWTIEAWVNPASFTNSQYPTIYADGEVDVSLGLNSTTGAPESWIQNNQLVGSIPVPLGEWSHMALTYNGTNRALYVNGILAGTDTPQAITPPTEDFAIGGLASLDPGYSYNGLIDEVSVYNRALSASEITAIYDAASLGKCRSYSPPSISAFVPVIGAAGNVITITGSGFLLTTNVSFNGVVASFAVQSDSQLIAYVPATASTGPITVSGGSGSTATVRSFTVNNAAACDPAPAGLLGWWPADGNADDVLGLPNGVLVAGTTFTSGLKGLAFSFDGVNNYVDLGPINPGATWTIEAWVNPSALPAGRHTIAGGVGDYMDWAISFDDAQFGVRSQPSSGATQNTPAAFTPVVGTWYHVAATCDGANASIYVDGVLQNFAPVNAFYSPFTNEIQISGESCCGGDRFPGLVDELAIYNRALSPAEIAALYNAGAAGKCASTNLVTVSLQASPEAGGSVSGAGSFPPGSTVVVTASPSSQGRWVFLNWAENGLSLSTNSSYTFVAYSDHSLVANFIGETNLFTQQPASQTNEAGSLASFSALIVSPAPLQFQWYFAGAAIAGATNSSLFLTNVLPSQAGGYTLVGRNSFGNVTSVVANLTVVLTSVNITSPTNGLTALAPASFSIKAAATDPNGIRQVNFYTNGVFCGQSASSPYQLSLTGLSAGSYALSGVAVDGLGLMKTSAVVHLTVNNPGSTLIDFEALDASSGPVGGAALSNYLFGFGVTATGLTPVGAAVAVVDDRVFLGGGAVGASSGDNFLVETAAGGAVSYTLNFSQGYASVGWVRPRVRAGTTGAALPAWRAYMFDSTGRALGSVGEAAQVSYTDLAAAPFTVLGPNIGSIRFDGNNGGASPLSTLPLDDLLLSTVVTNTTLQVGLASGAGTVLSAPGTVVLTATVSDAAGTAVSAQFYEGGNLVGTAALLGGVGTLTLQNLAAGNYIFTAVAGDNAGAVRSSAPLDLTMGAAAGVQVINFDALATGGGSVGGAALSNYLAGYGVRWSNVTVGTALEAVNAGVVTAAGGAVASSPPNYLTQEGLSAPVSFTLVFASPLGSFGFARAGLAAGTGGVSHPQWRATMLGADGTELGHAGEALIQSATNVPARTFVLTGLPGHGIAAARFDSDSQKAASFSAALLDDLILNASGAAAPLAVTLTTSLPATGSTPPPATDVLTATVTDHLGGNPAVSTNYTVFFYAGPNLLGSAGPGGNSLTVGPLLAGTYALRAEVVDGSGVAAYSSAVTNVVAGAGGNAAVVNFDSLSAAGGPVTGALLNGYLGQFGMSVSALSAGTKLAVENQGWLGGGRQVAASSPSNVVTQIGSNGPVSYTLSFGTLLSSFGFTRPELLAAPFASQPGWTATAYDAAGVVLDQASEGAMASYTNVGAQAFALSGPGIASVQLASAGAGLGALNALVADDFVLTTNAGGTPFPPAVALTAPGAGLQLTGVTGLPVTAVAADPAGVTGVGFYTNGGFIGTVLAAPYTVEWTNGGPGEYVLTAVATNRAGLTRTSPGVTVTVLPPAGEFGILTQPLSQTVATGSTVIFTVGTTGTNAVAYQWFQNGNALGGQTAASLVLSPAAAGNAGTYTVQASSGGVTLTSAAALLAVLDPPVFTTQPAGMTAAAGQNVLLTDEADGDYPLTWQWLLNGTSIAGATDKDYAIAAAQPLNSGKYQVVAANPVGFSVSAVAQVSVAAGSGQLESADSFAGRIRINPLLGAVAGNSAGAPLTGELAQIAGKPAGKIIWYTWQAGFTGVISLTTRGSDFDTLLGVYTGKSAAALTAVAADDDSGGYFTSLVTFNVTAGTNYQIAVGGFQGASGNVILGMPAGTGYRVLSPGPGSSVPVITRQPASQLALAGAKVTLSVGASNALTYQWVFQGTPVSGGTNSSLVLTNFQAGAVGLYDVLAANAAGSVQSEPASVQIAVVSQAGLTNAAHDKFGDAVDLAGGPGKAVEPEPAAGGGDTRGFSLSQTFSTVGGTKDPGEPDHCGQPGGSSQWYVYTAPAAGTLHVSTAGSTFNTIVAVYTGPGTNFASLVAQACGYTTNYQAQGQPSLVVPNVAAGTRYYIVVDGYQGAAGRAQLQVGLGSAPSLVTPPASQFATAGSNATFRVGAVGSTNLFYQWQFNGAGVARATNSSYAASNAGSYTVVVSNAVGAVTSAPPAVLVLQYAPGINAPPTNQTVTLGQKAGFSVGAAGVNTKANPFQYQWYFDGAAVSRATGSALSLAAAQWTNQGSYQVVVRNSFGAATSAVAVLAVRDPVPPTVAITNPVNNFVSQSPQVTVGGTAADNVGIQAVRVQVNNSAWQQAAGSNQWSLRVSLIPGTNLIAAQSVDLAGNTNTVPARRAIIYRVSAPLTVGTNGVGSVTSADGAANGASLILGNRYTLTATVLPKSNQLFDHWSSGAADLGDSNQLTFTMTSNLVLTANFVANLFPSVAGTYNGLFYPSQVAEASSGFFTAAVVSNGTGAYTAQLMLDGVTYHNANGNFNAEGQSQWIIPRAGSTPVTVGLNLHLNPPDDQLTGTVSNAAWTSILQADRAVFNAATAPATNYSGQFTLLLPPGPGAPQTQPGGYGYAAISNSLGGVSLILGALADGTPFSQSVAIAKDGSIPLYASLYNLKGTLLGWITFTNQPPKTLVGSVNWIKPPAAKTLYPLGFNLPLTNVLGSFYTNATLAGQPVLDLPAATLTLSNGNLTAPLVYHLALNSNHQLTNQPGGTSSTNFMTLAINPTNGILTVTFQAPGAKTNTIGRGAVLQDQTNAFGAFPAPTQSGAIILQ